MEAADRALDHEDTPIDDWGFINTYVLSDTYLKCIGAFARIPLLGRLFRNHLFDHFSVSYDICVNFIEGHEEASKMLIGVIQDSEFVQTIVQESKNNIEGSENYMQHHIEE